MRLSSKHTVAYIVMITWPDAVFDVTAFPNAQKAGEYLAERQRALAGQDVYLQIHKIEQALPKEPK